MCQPMIKCANYSVHDMKAFENRYKDSLDYLFSTFGIQEKQYLEDEIYHLMCLRISRGLRDRETEYRERIRDDKWIPFEYVFDFSYTERPYYNHICTCCWLRRNKEGHITPLNRFLKPVDNRCLLCGNTTGCNCKTLHTEVNPFVCEYYQTAYSFDIINKGAAPSHDTMDELLTIAITVALHKEYAYDADADKTGLYESLKAVFYEFYEGNDEKTPLLVERRIITALEKTLGYVEIGAIQEAVVTLCGLLARYEKLVFHTTAHGSRGDIAEFSNFLQLPYRRHIASKLSTFYSEYTLSGKLDKYIKELQKHVNVLRQSPIHRYIPALFSLTLFFYTNLTAYLPKTSFPDYNASYNGIRCIEKDFEKDSNVFSAWENTVSAFNKHLTGQALHCKMKKLLNEIQLHLRKSPSE